MEDYQLSNYKLNILKKFLFPIIALVLNQNNFYGYSFSTKKGFLQMKDLNNLEKITNILFSNKEND